MNVERKIAVVSVTAMAVLVGATLAGRIAADPRTWTVWLDVAVALAGVAAVPAVLRRPAAAGIGLAVLVALSPVATPPATFAALQTARERRFPVAVGVAVLGVAAHAVLGLWRPFGGLSYAWWLTLIAFAYAALLGWGAYVRANAALVATLRERARRAEAEQGRRVAEARLHERGRIAREMHDVLAHRLSLLATYAGALEYRPDAPPEKLARAAGVVREGVHQALVELREVIGVLRDADGSDDDRPQPVLGDLPRLVAESRDAGVDVVLRNEVTDPSGPPGVAGRTAYRVVQEGLTNARKHAAGQPVTVSLDGTPGAKLTIDVRNPLSTDPDAAPSVPGAGTGLIGLTERVRLAGGTLDHSVTGSGEFRLTASLPWPA